MEFPSGAPYPACDSFRWTTAVVNKAILLSCLDYEIVEHSPKAFVASLFGVRRVTVQQGKDYFSYSIR